MHRERDRGKETEERQKTTNRGEEIQETQRRRERGTERGE